MEINLKKILMTAGWNEPLTEAELDVAFRTGIYNIDHVLIAMQTACLQTVDLCADDVYASVGYDCEDDTYNAEISMDSILKVKEKIINEIT